MALNVLEIRKQFPLLEKKIREQPLVYMDSAATTLKPLCVAETLKNFYLYESANVHRGAHYLSDQATARFESARFTVQKFINAHSSNEVIFTSGTTDSINLVAHSFSQASLKEGDEVLLTEMEHHSNIVPWQVAAQKRKAKIRVIPVNTLGELDLTSLDQVLNSRTKIVSLSLVSNALGVINPVKKIIEKAHSVGAKVLVDAAQAMSVTSVDVQNLDCDFLAFSGHKMFGPHGIGVLYGKEDLLNMMPPYRTGGSMIDEVTFDKTTYLKSPQRFEAGTPHTAGAIGLACAIDFISEIGLEKIYEHEKSMSRWAIDELKKIEGLEIMGETQERVNILPFNILNIHASDLGQILDQQGIAIRSGHHCCQPLMKKLGVTGSARASLSIYNTEEEVKKLVKAIIKSKEILL